jgi:heavy metal sensor kinase
MSLRIRLTANYTLFFALALLILGSGLYLLVRQLLLQGVIDELRVGSTLVLQAYQVNSEVISDPSGIDIVLRPPDLGQVESPELYVQVSRPDGALLARSSNLGEQRLPLTAQDLQRAVSGQEVTPIERIGTARVQSLIVPLRLESQIVGVVQVAQSLRQIDRSLDALLWALVGGGLITLLAAARGSLWLARAALQPIDQVSATAGRILRAEDLHQRVPDATTNDEVGRLIRTINGMLERMERMFSAQQRFTADVAHELRTPLAAMRGNLEILRRGALNDPQMLAESLQDIERETLRLTRMANDLLVLAQADAGLPLRLGPVQLDEVLIEVYRELRPLAGDSALAIDLRDEIALTGDRDRIKQALLNLVANALQHAPVGKVTISLRREQNCALLAVQDSGPGIPEQQQALLFDRFFRGDQSRSQGGAGLGLSIVKWIAEAHGGQVSVESGPGRGSTFCLKLPIQPDAANDQRLLTSADDRPRAA